MNKPPLAPATYSKSFSEHVVKDMWEKYPRATELAAELVGLPVKGLAIFFAKDQPMWTMIRAFIHDLEELRSIHGGFGDTEQVLSKIRLWYESNRMKRILDRIDEVRKVTNNKEAEARGRLCEAQAEQRHPSGFLYWEVDDGLRQGLLFGALGVEDEGEAATANR